MCWISDSHEDCRCALAHIEHMNRRDDTEQKPEAGGPKVMTEWCLVQWPLVVHNGCVYCCSDSIKTISVIAWGQLLQSSTVWVCVKHSLAAHLALFVSKSKCCLTASVPVGPVLWQPLVQGSCLTPGSLSLQDPLVTVSSYVLMPVSAALKCHLISNLLYYLILKTVLSKVLNFLTWVKSTDPCQILLQ